MITVCRAARGLGARHFRNTTPRNHLSKHGGRNKSSTSQDETPPSRLSNSGPTSPRLTGENTAQPKSAPTPPIDIPSVLWYQRLGPVTDFFAWFHRTQEKRPYTVQLSTSLIVYLCGDLVAQDVGGEKYDPIRTLRMLTIGAIASAPGYRWFLFLGNHFNYPSQIRSVAAKVVVQQMIFTPVFNTYFFGMQAILTGERPSGVLERIRKAVPISIANSIKVWPAVTAVSFAFILPQYRFMFSGVFAVAWQAYLSFLNRREEKSSRPGSNAGSGGGGRLLDEATKV